jgi:Delta7-sterol 5-desaturase
MTSGSISVELLAILGKYSWEVAYRYFGFSLLAFALIWWAASRRSPGSRPMPQAVKRRQLVREFFYSLSTIVICAAIAPVVLVLGFGRNLNFYGEIGEYGWLYFFFSILLMMFVRDTLFYWEHRFMHLPKLFRHAHRIHHQSLQTTPLSGFSVHPWEGLFAAALPYALILFLIPKHPLAYLVFVYMDAAVAVLTHMGYEIFPKGFSRHWLGRWIGTPTAHQIHHTNPRRNYALYFLFWDRWMGTLDENYDKCFDIAAGTSAPQAPIAAMGQPRSAE